MKITGKIRKYNQFIDEFDSLIGTVIEQWEEYSSDLHEAYGDLGYDVPKIGYIGDMRDKVLAVQEIIQEGLAALERKYCQHEIEEGFEDIVITEEDRKPSEDDGLPF